MNCNVTALKDKCKAKGLSGAGRKEQLINRLLGFDSTNEAGGKSSGAAGRTTGRKKARTSTASGSRIRKKRVVDEDGDEDAEEEGPDSEEDDGVPTAKNTRMEGVGYQRIPLRSEDISLQDYVMGRWSNVGKVQWWVAQVAEIHVDGTYAGRPGIPGRQRHQTSSSILVRGREEKAT